MIGLRHTPRVCEACMLTLQFRWAWLWNPQSWCANHNCNSMGSECSHSGVAICEWGAALLFAHELVMRNGIANKRK